MVQLRKDNASGTIYNLVGFQTHLRFPEQKRVFSMIPALRDAEFVRYGVMHRNTFLQSPKLLDCYYADRRDPLVAFAGQIASMEMGLSMASMLDPTTKENTTVTGVYYNYIILLLLISSGMHRYFLKALAETYILIPINGAVLDHEKLLNAMIKFLSEYIIIGFRICLPIFAVMIILNAVLGVLAKVSPQLNMFAVGMQMKVLVGLSILLVTASMLPDAANFIYDQMKHMVVTFVETML